MSEAEAFLQAILNNPEDDGLRLVYADWLEERGDPRGEFIRVQIALARRPTGAERRALRLRERALLQEHRARWTEPLREQVFGCRFRRGFVEEVLLPTDQFVSRTAELFRLAPVQRLRLRRAVRRLAELADCPFLSRLRTLDLGRNGLGDEAVRVMAGSPYLGRLTRLVLPCNDIGDAGARALAASGGLQRLRVLDLENNQLSDAGAQSLAAAGLPRLSVLAVGDNALSLAGWRALHARYGDGVSL